MQYHKCNEVFVCTSVDHLSGNIVIQVSIIQHYLLPFCYFN
jgi:hypothetical protein